jgi:NAD+ kinase
MSVRDKRGVRRAAAGQRPLRVALCGRNLEDIAGVLRRFPVHIVERQPDMVIAYGGDGALLGAERAFPGVTKCPIRDRRSTPKCPRHGEAKIIRLLLDGRLDESWLCRLEAAGPDGRRVTGINDVLVNKENISSAVRFRVWLNGQLYKSQVVGDGLVVATPFGSTGYYRSITRSLFRVGIGLAFNNSTEQLDHLVVDDGTAVEVEILRGPAVLLADNAPERIGLNRGDRVIVRKGKVETCVLGLDVFRCEACYQLRQDGDGLL